MTALTLHWGSLHQWLLLKQLTQFFPLALGHGSISRVDQDLSLDS